MLYPMSHQGCQPHSFLLIYFYFSPVLFIPFYKYFIIWSYKTNLNYEYESYHLYCAIPVFSAFNSKWKLQNSIVLFHICICIFFSRPVDTLCKMNSVVFISLLGTVTFCQCSSAFWWVRKDWKGRELWVFSFCVITVSEFVYVWGGLSVFWWSVVPLYCGGFSQWVG